MFSVGGRLQRLHARYVIVDTDHVGCCPVEDPVEGPVIFLVDGDLHLVHILLCVHVRLLLLEDVVLTLLGDRVLLRIEEGFK